jgi:hypothetical protein
MYSKTALRYGVGKENSGATPEFASLTNGTGCSIALTGATPCITSATVLRLG